MRIYLKNIPAKFHPNLIWKDRALGFSWTGHLNKSKISSDMTSVPDPKADCSNDSENINYFCWNGTMFN